MLSFVVDHGIKIDLDGNSLANRTLLLAKKEGPGKAFIVKGIGEKPFEAEIFEPGGYSTSEWPEGGETFLRGRCRINGLPCRILLEPGRIESFEIQSAGGKIALSSLRVKNGSQIAEIPVVTDVEIWNHVKHEHFASESSWMLASDGISLNVPITDLQSFTRGPDDNAEVVLTNGEIHRGRLNTSTNIRGQVLEERFGGFSAIGTFNLGDARSLKRVRIAPAATQKTPASSQTAPSGQ